MSEKASREEKFNWARYYMEIVCIYRIKSVAHMNSSKLDTELYIWKRSVELFFSDEKSLTIADTTGLIRYLLLWIILHLAVKRIYSSYSKVIFYILVDSL